MYAEYTQPQLTFLALLPCVTNILSATERISNIYEQFGKETNKIKVAGNLDFKEKFRILIPCGLPCITWSTWKIKRRKVQTSALFMVGTKIEEYSDYIEFGSLVFNW